MKSIQRILGVGVTIALSVSLIACGGSKEKRQRTNINVGNGVDVVDSQSFDGQGVIFEEDSRTTTQAEFQNSIEEIFAGILLNDEKLGEVRKEEGAETGVRFSGRIEVENGCDIFNGSRGNSNLRLSNDFIVQVRDSKSLLDPNVSGVNVVFRPQALQASSYMNDRQIRILLGDQNSSVQFEFVGEIQSSGRESNILGLVRYNNPEIRQSGVLGRFLIETGSLLSCNN